MKRLTVVLFLICGLFGEWQQTEEIALTKGLQINDIAISSKGEIWMLTSSAILRFEPSSKTPIFITDAVDVKLFAVDDGSIYLVRNNNRLAVFNVADGTSDESEAGLTAASQLAVVNVADQRSLIALEPGKLTFWDSGKSTGVLVVDAERFATVPLTDYSESSSVLYTLKDNRIHEWSGGAFQHPENYRNRVYFSSSNRILDMAADKSGRLFVLLADSIVVLNSNGKYGGRIPAASAASETRLLNDPSSQAIALFNKTDRKLVYFSEVKKDNGDLITLNKNKPNPVDNYTEIEFTLSRPLNIALTVYNLIGEPVKVLAKGQFIKGTHRVFWNACDEKGNLVPNGVYFYRLETNRGVAIKQLVVLR